MGPFKDHNDRFSYLLLQLEKPQPFHALSLNTEHHKGGTSSYIGTLPLGIMATITADLYDVILNYLENADVPSDKSIYKDIVLSCLDFLQMMLTAVMGIMAVFTYTPVQPNTARVNAVSINLIGL